MTREEREADRILNSITGSSNDEWMEELPKAIASALKKARNEAIEECARVAKSTADAYKEEWEKDYLDAISNTGDEIATSIRDLSLRGE